MFGFSFYWISGVSLIWRAFFCWGKMFGILGQLFYICIDRTQICFIWCSWQGHGDRFIVAFFVRKFFDIVGNKLID